MGKFLDKNIVKMTETVSKHVDVSSMIWHKPKDMESHKANAKIIIIKNKKKIYY